MESIYYEVRLIGGYWYWDLYINSVWVQDGKHSFRFMATLAAKRAVKKHKAFRDQDFVKSKYML